MGFGSDKTGFYKPSAVTVTATGNPLTLQNAKRLRKLTIYGNAVQDGTPSPDAPVEVQLCGDRTGNLFDKKHASNIDNWELSTSKDNGYYELQGIANGETITIALKLNSTLAVNSGIWFYTYDDVYKTGFNPQTTELQTTTMTYADGDYMRLYVPGTNGAVKNYMNLVNADLQIIRGSYTADTLPAYEPYGYKVSGRAEGLNLLDYDVFEAGAISGSTGTDLDNSLSIRTGAYIEICPNTRYHISFAESLYLRIIFYASDKSFISQIYVASGSYSFTTPNQTFYIRLSLQGINNQLEPSSIQAMLVQGSYTAETMPPYEPYQPPQDFAVYLPEQIAKVGDVADEVVVDMEKQTAELKKNVGSVVVSDRLASSETGSKGDDIALFYKFFPGRFIANSETVSVMSDKLVGLSLSDYKNSSSKDMLSLAGNNTNMAVFMKLSKTDIGGDTAESANTWIADNRITVYYVLATPVTTDITSLQQWDAMPQVKGTVTLTLSAEVDPSGAEAVYTASKRPKAQAALIEENTIPEEPAETQVSDTDINTEIIMMED